MASGRPSGRGRGPASSRRLARRRAGPSDQRLDVDRPLPVPQLADVEVVRLRRRGPRCAASRGRCRCPPASGAGRATTRSPWFSNSLVPGEALEDRGLRPPWPAGTSGSLSVAADAAGRPRRACRRCPRRRPCGPCRRTGTCSSRWRRSVVEASRGSGQERRASPRYVARVRCGEQLVAAARAAADR